MANDRSEYLNDGFRDDDAREGFGDDGGTRVGRPDGAGSNASPRDPNHGGGAQRAPLDASGGQIPGQAGTNAGPVDDGIEGSLTDGDEPRQQGAQQARVQAAAEGAENPNVNPGRPAGDDRRVFDL